MSRPDPWTVGRLALLYLVIVLGLFACNKEAAPPPFEGPPVTAPVVETPVQTGFWADDTEVCPTAKPKPSTMLHWDVTGVTQNDVIVYVMDPRSKDTSVRSFSKGGPKDEHKTGKWLTPGMVFTLKEDGTGKELGSITIDVGPCE